MRFRRFVIKWLPSKKQVRKNFIYSVFSQIFSRQRLVAYQPSFSWGGLSLGLFIALTLTIPFQMILTCLGALYFRVNLPVGFASCWVTNPLTAMPVYLTAWRAGKNIIAHLPFIAEFLTAYSSNGRASSLMIHSLYLWTGSLIMAGSAALISNLLIKWLWKEYAETKLK